MPTEADRSHPGATRRRGCVAVQARSDLREWARRICPRPVWRSCCTGALLRPTTETAPDIVATLLRDLYPISGYTAPHSWIVMTGRRWSAARRRDVASRYKREPGETTCWPVSRGGASTPTIWSSTIGHTCVCIVIEGVTIRQAYTASLGYDTPELARNPAP